MTTATMWTFSHFFLTLLGGQRADDRAYPSADHQLLFGEIMHSSLHPPFDLSIVIDMVLSAAGFFSRSWGDC
jgi:hypothetical protein